MNDKQINRLSSSNKLVDAFKLMKNNIMQDLHVATLGYYKETIKEYDINDGYGIISVRPFPLPEGSDEYTINVYFIEDTNFVDNEVVIVLYTDLNFSRCLENNYTDPKVTNDKHLHSQMNGILIKFFKEEE